MIRQTAPAPRPPDQQALTVAGVPVTPIGMVVGAAALRGLAVAVAGLLALSGLAILIWALTPASGTEAAEALRAGVAAFAAANLMPVWVAGIPLTLSPLLCTALLVALLAVTAQRGRFQPEGRYQETLAILTTAVVYGLVAAAAVRGFGPAEAIPASAVWTAPLLALVAVFVGTLARPSGWRTWWLLVAPAWVRRAVRAGAVAAAALVGGGAVVLCAGLLLHFGSAVGISAIAAPTWADGLGLAVVGLAYVPNAVVAAVSYVTGVGFEAGPATFSPLGSTAADLPAVPLLAAVPENAGPTALSLLVFLVPFLAGLLAGRVLVRRPSGLSQRVAGALVASVLAGGVAGVLALVGSGGAGAGRWSSFGPPPLLLAGVVTSEILVVALCFAMLSGIRRPRTAAAGPAQEDRDAPSRRAAALEEDLLDDAPAGAGDRAEADADQEPASADPASVDPAGVDPAGVDSRDVDSGDVDSGGDDPAGDDRAADAPATGEAAATDDSTGTGERAGPQRAADQQVGRQSR